MKTFSSLVIALVVIALGTLATFCNQKDTGPQDVWRRTVEPRLSNASEWQPCQAKPLASGRVVEETQCGPAEAPTSTEACDEIIDTHVQALRILSFQPRCTDAAIQTLERFARTDAGAMSDVSAAYYLRAQREDRPSDFLRALEAADQAVAAAPDLPAARFNRALAQEALGLKDAAITSWNEFLKSEDSDWTDEARQRSNRLNATLDDAQRWQHNYRALPNALQRRDREEVAQLIAPFPYEAQRYFDEVLLSQWAAAPTPEHLDQIRLFAAELSARQAGDAFITEISDAIVRASPSQFSDLREGHRAFEMGRSAGREIDFRAAGMN